MLLLLLHTHTSDARIYYMPYDPGISPTDRPRPPRCSSDMTLAVSNLSILETLNLDHTVDAPSNCPIVENNLTVEVSMNMSFSDPRLLNHV